MTVALWLLGVAVAQTLTVTGGCPGYVALDLTEATPGGEIVILTGKEGGDASLPAGPCAGVASGLGAPLRRLGRPVPVALDGTRTLTPAIPTEACGSPIVAVDLETCAVSLPTTLAPFEPVRGEQDLAERADAAVHGDRRLFLAGHSLSWVDADDDDDLEVLYAFYGDPHGVKIHDGPLPDAESSRSASVTLWSDFSGDLVNCGHELGGHGQVAGRSLVGLSCDGRFPTLSRYFLFAAPLSHGNLRIEDAAPYGTWTASTSLSIRATRAEEVTGDGIEDIALIDWNLDTYGRITIASDLRTDGLVDVSDLPRELHGPGGRFGRDTVLLDYTGDGLHDIAAGDYYRYLSLVPSPLPEGYSHTDDVASGTIHPEIDVFDDFGQALDAGGSEGGVDADGDGLTDLVAGGDEVDGRGAVYLFTDLPREGKALYADDAAQARVYGLEPGGRFGVDVALARDINGDGDADVVATAAGGFYFAVGDLYVFYGPLEGVYTAEDADATLLGGDAVGVRTLSIADANLDGYSDIAVGAENTSELASRGGAVFVFFGGPE